jgi:hypothetical protein
MRRSLSDERMGLSFTIAAGSCDFVKYLRTKKGKGKAVPVTRREGP